MRHLRLYTELEYHPFTIEVFQSRLYWDIFDEGMILRFYSRWITPMTDEDSN